MQHIVAYSCTVRRVFRAGWMVMHNHRADIVWSPHEAELSVDYCKVTWKGIFFFFMPACFGAKGSKLEGGNSNNTTRWSLSRGERGMKVHMWKYKSVQMLQPVEFQLKWSSCLPSRSPLSLFLSHCAAGYVYFVYISVTFRHDCNPKKPKCDLKQQQQSDITTSGSASPLAIWEMTETVGETRTRSIIFSSSLSSRRLRLKLLFFFFFWGNLIRLIFSSRLLQLAY